MFTQEDIEKAFRNTNFGVDTWQEKHEILLRSVLKKAIGYYTGWTIECIMKELKLIGKNNLPTKKGRKFLREHYKHLTEGSG